MARASHRRKILVWPGGNEIGLEIWKSLKDCKEVELYSAGTTASSHAPYVYERHLVLPDVFSDGWIEAVAKTVRGLGIDYIYPAHDYVGEALARHRSEIPAAVIAPPIEVFDICGSKRATHRRFHGKLPMPRLLDPGAEFAFPVFVKPDRGYGSRGARRADDPQMLQALLRQRSDLLVFEHLPGREFTIDCFSDRERGLLFAGGRERQRVRMGTSVHAVGVADALNREFAAMAEVIAAELPLRGPWFFQVKEDRDGSFRLLEINARIAGTMAYHRVLGVNFALLGIFEEERLPLGILVNPIALEMDRALTNRFRTNLAYERIYLDLDDSLIRRGRLNIEMVKFLHQSRERGRSITLLTKSLVDPVPVLRSHRIETLFDEIRWIAEADSKADHIDPAGAIFIDDSFSQRREVAERHGIPTFDPSMLEMLIDDRM